MVKLGVYVFNKVFENEFKQLTVVPKKGTPVRVTPCSPISIDREENHTSGSSQSLR